MACFPEFFFPELLPGASSQEDKGVLGLSVILGSVTLTCHPLTWR